MLLRSLTSALLFSIIAAAQSHAGIGLHFSGQPVQHHGGQFNFAVSATNQDPMEPSDSPSEPISPFFSEFIQLRVYTLPFGGPGITPPMGGGSGFGGGSPGGFGVNGGEAGGGVLRKQFAMLGNRAGGGFGGGFGGGGGGGGGGFVAFGLVVDIPGAGTTSPDQTVSGSDGIVCVTKTGTTDPGTDNGGESGGAGPGDDGQTQPNPSAVPEPSSFALWTLMTGMLIFGTRRVAG